LIKLSWWRGKRKSFAGRVPLAKNVMEVIPIYLMMTTKIPKTCLDEIQKQQQNFILGDTDSARKYHALQLLGGDGN
jgi:hypothetical protein